MPFDPDAYLASKSSGGFDPDAYLSSKDQGKPSVSSSPAEPKAPGRTAWQNVKDALNTPRDVLLSAASGAVAAPIANVAGLAATGYEAITGGSKGDGDMPSRFRDDVRDRLTYHPDNHLLNEGMRSAGAVAAPVGQALHGAADFVRGDGPANSPRVMAANAGIEGVKQAPGVLGVRFGPGAVRTAERGVDTLMGTSAKAAKGEALTATRGALGDVDANLGRQVSGKVTEANEYADTAVRTQRALDAARQRGVPTSDVLGGQVRDDYLKVIADAKASREAAVDPLYAKAKAAAAAREAQGQFVDVKPAVKDLDEMLKLSENLPDLHAKLLKLRQSVEAPAPKGGAPAPSIVDERGQPLTKPLTPQGRPLSYAELDMASRYIKDIAFSGEAEGYGALIRNTAKRLSVKLDEQIAASVPEHAAATAKYRELSQPMETLSTRIGAALYDTEGGLKGEAYSKVPTQDLPSRVFGKRDRVEQLVDALAGGKNATPAARAAAQAKVDTWVENWILDQTNGKVGSEAARAIAAPGMRATLNAVPEARARLNAQFGREVDMERVVPDLNKAADASRLDAATLQKRQADIRSKIEKADIDLAHGSEKEAYDAYVSSLRASMGATDPEKYRAAVALIERAGSLEEKTAKAQMLVKTWTKRSIYGAAAVGGMYETRKALQ